MSDLRNLLTRALGLGAFLLAIEGGAVSSRAQACSDAGIVVSTLAVGGLVVYDIATAPSSVRRYNESQVAFAPYVNARDRSYGVSVTWFFGKARPPVALPVHRLPIAQDPVRSRRSPGMGFALSFLSTAAPMAAGAAIGNGAGATVFLTGVVIGPSVGHFYAGRVGRGLGTAALRGAGTAVFIVSIAGCFLD